MEQFNDDIHGSNDEVSGLHAAQPLPATNQLGPLDELVYLL
jgi:hypothetical protein